LAILAKNQTEPENAVSRFLHFQCLTGIEDGAIRESRLLAGELICCMDEKIGISLD
jgi:hypothetical protein